MRREPTERRKETMRKRLIAAASSIVCLTMLSLGAEAQQRVYQGPSQSTRQAILRLENRANLFRNGVQAWSQANASETYSSEDLNMLARDFNNGVRRLRDWFDLRQATSSHVRAVLS